MTPTPTPTTEDESQTTEDESQRLEDESRRICLDLQCEDTTTLAAQLVTSTKNAGEAFGIAYSELDAAWAEQREAEAQLDAARSHVTAALMKAAAVVTLTKSMAIMDALEDDDA